jgi:hypothetical protein
VNEERMKGKSECETTGSSGKLTENRSRRAGLKKGVDVAVGERKTGRKKNEEQDKRKTLQEQPSRKRTGDAPLGYLG